MEALQVLKFALKKSRLNFTAHLQLPDHFMNGDGPEPANTLAEMLKLNPEALAAFLDVANFCDWIGYFTTRTASMYYHNYLDLLWFELIDWFTLIWVYFDSEMF